MRKVSSVLVAAILILFTLSGCGDTSKFGDGPTVGATAGGVVGAGLGALIGSQVGDTSTGLVLGALAGAGAGSVMGRQIENQENILNKQDKAIEDQDLRLQQQQRELELLRGSNRDLASTHTIRDSNVRVIASDASEFRGQLRSAQPIRETDLSVTNPNTLNVNLVPQAKLPPIEPVLVSVKSLQPSAATDQEALPPVRELRAPTQEPAGQAVTAALIPSTPQTEECRQADGEVAEAKKASDGADKLFHFRRALRLCPENAAYHNGLGEVYLALGRVEDAEYEFKEALNISPGFTSAARNLEGIRSQNY